MTAYTAAPPAEGTTRLPQRTALRMPDSKPAWLFLAPAVILFVFLGLCFVWVRDTPLDAGLPNFDVADASSGHA